MRFRLFALIISLFLATALYAEDYAPDTLWSRQIEIEGFSSLQLKVVEQTLDGGYLLGCNYFVESQNYDAVIIKLGADYEVEWYTVIYTMTFAEQPNRIRLLENGGYDILLRGEYPSALLHLSAEGDSLGMSNLGEFSVINDAIQKPDGGYIILRLNTAIGLDSLGNVEWTRQYDECQYFDWNELKSIERTENGKFVVGGCCVDEESSFPNVDLLVGLINDQGVMLYSSREFVSRYYIAPYQCSAYEDGWFYYKYNGELRKYCVNDTLELITYNGFYPVGEVGIETVDEGCIGSGVEFICTRYVDNYIEMWSREYDLDHDENEPPYLRGRDKALAVFQEADSSFLLVGNDYTLNEGYKPVLIKLAPESLKGIILIGNELETIINPVVNSTHNLTWHSWGVEGNLNIELSHHFTDGPWEMLAENTPNDGNENLSYSPPEAEFCYLRISSVDDTLQYIPEWSFSIDPTRRTFFFQEADNPGVYLNSFDFGDIEYGVEQSMNLSVWGAHYLYSGLSYLYNIRQEYSGHFSAASSGSVPGTVENCLIEISVFPDFLGNTSGMIGFVTNAYQGDSLYFCPGCAFPDSSLTMLYFSANVVVTPQSPQITLRRNNLDIIINWEPVTHSVAGINITNCPLRYFVFRGNSLGSIEYLSASTTATQHRDVSTIHNNYQRFYSVVAAIDSPALSQASQNWTGKSKTFVLEQINELNGSSTTKLPR